MLYPFEFYYVEFYYLLCEIALSSLDIKILPSWQLSPFHPRLHPLSQKPSMLLLPLHVLLERFAQLCPKSPNENSERIIFKIVSIYLSFYLSISI